MSTWSDHDLEAKVLEVLYGVPLENPLGHPFHRPFLTAYQVAICIDRRWPEVRESLGLPLGGLGIGARNSFAQYLARELSRRARAQTLSAEIEGGFLASQEVASLSFRGDDGVDFSASFVESGYDLSMYRIRPASN
ncbi:MAG: hypothetical protein KDC47_08580 [Flavobacteriaceae bacterium]|nr:hypothetical protein [Flavobacteriaceae bacterium]